MYSLKIIELLIKNIIIKLYWKYYITLHSQWFFNYLVITLNNVVKVLLGGLCLLI